MKTTETKPSPYAGHTPGPWQVLFGGMEGDTFATIGRNDLPYAIACVEPRGYVQANAALIADAPALLAERDALRGELAKSEAEAYALWAELERRMIVGHERDAVRAEADEAIIEMGLDNERLRAENEAKSYAMEDFSAQLTALRMKSAETHAGHIHEIERLRAALDTLMHVVGLTAFKHEGQRAALEAAMNQATAVLEGGKS